MKSTALSIILAGILVGGAIIYTSSRSNSADNSSAGTPSVDNVSIVDGKQVIEISAKGGYSPRVTSAKAGIPTVIKMDTTGTFDCSSSLVIPSIGYRNILPLTGETLIDVRPQESGTVLQGLCSMGMYNFQIQFN